MLTSRRVRLRAFVRGLLGLLPFALWLAVPTSARAQLLEGLDSWADATVGLRTTKWRGPRVPYPLAEPRPALPVRVDSLLQPVRVHAARELGRARLEAVLAAAEQADLSLRSAGLLTRFGDAGQGESGARDLYVVPAAEQGASAAIDLSGALGPLDGARAFARIDARLPSERLLPCVAQALMEAELLEQDPAESLGVRRSSAAYFASLVTGQLGCDGDDAREPVEAGPFLTAHEDEGARWLAALDARMSHGRAGSFLFDMWQFARQRTWEGSDLRASPDLLEAIAKALELSHGALPLVAAELAETRLASEPGLARSVRWDALPAFLRDGPPLEPLGAAFARVELGTPRTGERLHVWARGEPPVRFTLAAVRLSATGEPLARLEVLPRKLPQSQLLIELDADTHAVSISITALGESDQPDPDTMSRLEAHPVTLTIARQ